MSYVKMKKVFLGPKIFAQESMEAEDHVWNKKAHKPLKYYKLHSAYT